jgi:hypothetical protein
MKSLDAKQNQRNIPLLRLNRTQNVYAKIFAQIYDGTLCTKGPWQALVTFQQFLVLADQDGQVDMTASAIARRTTIPLEIISMGIDELLKPDPESRTPTEEGRRILPLCEGRNWGWKIVNYKHYRALKREEERREYHRAYWHKRKNSTKNSTTQPGTTESTTHNTLNENQPIAEAEAEAYAKAKKDKSAKKATVLPDDFALSEESIAYALNKKLNLETELVSFKNFHQAKGSTWKDWQATWRTWCDKAVEFGRSGNGKINGYKSIHDQRAETIAVLTGRKSNVHGTERDITGESQRIAG